MHARDLISKNSQDKPSSINKIGHPDIRLQRYLVGHKRVTDEGLPLHRKKVNDF